MPNVQTGTEVLTNLATKLQVAISSDNFGLHQDGNLIFLNLARNSYTNW